METAKASFPFEEPGIVQILIYASFLFTLNVVNSLLNHIICCGLLGQVLIGVAWGTPGAKWLSSCAEGFITDLGYLGLILLVYEGGLSTSMLSLRANLFLSCAVALTGVGLPIVLSFPLIGIADSSPLQAFAAGAALCSTSLGTTFTVLSTCGLTSTKLGVVLSSAAIMDDVIGLVMIQIISNIGGSKGGPVNAMTTIRPIIVSLGFAIILPVACAFFVGPVTRKVMAIRDKRQNSTVTRITKDLRFVLIVHTLIIIALVSGASYAGTSVLFAAYEAGACINWWDRQLWTSRPQEQSLPVKHSSSPEITAEHSTPEKSTPQSRIPSSPIGSPDIQVSNSGITIYETYFAQPTQRILKPFFFASIGFSIPITQMFRGHVVWRGIVYAIFMVIGKFLCGLWLIRFHTDWESYLSTLMELLVPERISMLFRKSRAATKPMSNVKSSKTGEGIHQKPQSGASASDPSQESGDLATGALQTPQRSQEPAVSSEQNKAPRSLYPAAILGSAMVARGEIGFLVSSIAASNGIFNSSASEDIFLIVTWAIVLCTVAGPISVGFLVRMLRNLQKKTSNVEGGQAGQWDALGAWGVS